MQGGFAKLHTTLTGGLQHCGHIPSGNLEHTPPIENDDCPLNHLKTPPWSWNIALLIWVHYVYDLPEWNQEEALHWSAKACNWVNLGVTQRSVRNWSEQHSWYWPCATLGCYQGELWIQTLNSCKPTFKLPFMWDTGCDIRICYYWGHFWLVIRHTCIWKIDNHSFLWVF